jgi:hypothetical protein
MINPDISLSLSPPFCGATGAMGPPPRKPAVSERICGPRWPQWPQEVAVSGFFGRVSGQITCPPQLFLRPGSTTHRQSLQP